jgi:hypothetical protein
MYIISRVQANPTQERQHDDQRNRPVNENREQRPLGEPRQGMVGQPEYASRVAGKGDDDRSQS